MLDRFRDWERLFFPSFVGSEVAVDVAAPSVVPSWILSLVGFEVAAFVAVAAPALKAAGLPVKN